MAKIIEIHYASPEWDQFKVPRPHFIEVDDSGNAGAPEGGEAGPVNSLVGFAKESKPGYKFTAPDFYLLSDLIDGTVSPGDLTGYYAQFAEDGGFFGFNIPIEEVVLA
jgi:hypothetical protein